MEFVLVHGAWHGAWCWEALVPVLEGRGARVATPELPGHGADTTPASEVTLDAYVDRVVAAVEAASGPVELVGHSMGGIVISAVAERVPDRVRGLTYLCAFLPRNGEVLGRLGAEDTESALNPAIRPGPVDGTLGVDETLAPDIFYQDCPDEAVRGALARLTPQPVAPLQTPVHLTDGAFGRVPRAYVLCTEDRAVTPTMQRTLIERSPCDPVLELACGHSPFIADPEALADALVSIAGERS